MGFVETFRKLMKKRKEATATGGGAALAAPADTTSAAGKIGLPGEEFTEDEIKAMGHTYGGTAPGRVSTLQQFLMKGKKKK